MAHQFTNINQQTTLFIDRDGVINHEKPNDYIHVWEEFEFYDGVLEAFAVFAKKFKYIIVVTNQRGIGKGITQERNVLHIHANMKTAIENAGGKIDAIFYCPDIDSSSTNRKPNIGMALQAKQQFADIDFNNCYMVGNTTSDMQFGKTLGATTIFLPTTKPDITLQHPQVDFIFNTLIDFAKAL